MFNKHFRPIATLRHILGRQWYLGTIRVGLHTHTQIHIRNGLDSMSKIGRFFGKYVTRFKIFVCFSCCPFLFVSRTNVVAVCWIGFITIIVYAYTIGERIVDTFRLYNLQILFPTNIDNLVFCPLFHLKKLRNSASGRLFFSFTGFEKEIERRWGEWVCIHVVLILGKKLVCKIITVSDG